MHRIVSYIHILNDKSTLKEKNENKFNKNL